MDDGRTGIGDQREILCSTEPSSLHQEQELQPAMPGPQAQGPNPPPWQAPLLLTQESLIAKGAANVSLYEKNLSREISFFFFLLNCYSHSMSVLSPFYHHPIYVPSDDIGQCTIFTHASSYHHVPYFLLLLFNLGLLQLRKIANISGAGAEALFLSSYIHPASSNSWKIIHLILIFISSFLPWELNGSFIPLPPG